jgi:HAD superfamily hydrolase (TIGR01549 family)
MKRYKAIIFDLFDTIVHFDYKNLPPITTTGSKGFSIIIEHSYAVFARHYPHIGFSKFQETLQQIYQELLITKDIEHREIPAIERFRVLFARLNIEKTRDSESHMEELLLSHMDLLVKTTLFPQDNYSVLERLAQYYRLALISNFDHVPTLYRILDMYQIRNFFEEILISVELGLRKPRPEIFTAMLQRLKIPAQEAIYIGDNLQVDVIGSKNAGLDVVWLNKKGDTLKGDIPQPDYIVSSLEELLPVFGNLTS